MVPSPAPLIAPIIAENRVPKERKTAELMTLLVSRARL